MDDPTEERPDSEAIKVVGFAEHADDIGRASVAIFGFALSAADFAEFIAAPPGSSLSVEASFQDDNIELSLAYSWFEDTHDYLVYRDGGRCVVQIENVHVKMEAPELFETRLFARQVNSFRRFGIVEVRLFAAGHFGDPRG